MVAEYLAAHAGTLTVATLERRFTIIVKVHTSRGLVSPTRSDLDRIARHNEKHRTFCG